MGNCNWSYSKDGTKKPRSGGGSNGDTSARSQVASPLKEGESQSIRTYYSKRGYYKDTVLDAKWDGSTGTMTFDYAEDRDWDDTVNRPSNVQQWFTATVKNGMINGDTVNIDLDDKSIKAIDAPSNLDKSIEQRFRKSGFDYNSRSQKWEKGYKGYSTEGATLYVDSALPDTFNGITRIKTKYGAVDTRPIKSAGFRWDSSEKAWVKK